MDYSNHTALFQPLVGTEAHPQSPSPTPSVPTTVVSTTSPTTSTTITPPKHDMWISVLLFALMYIHFGLIYYSDPNHIIHGVSWTTMNVSISLFIIATFLYRHALHDCQVQNDLIMLLPELFVLGSMALAFGHMILMAFFILAIGKLYMAFTVILINSYQLWSISAVTSNDDDECQDDNEDNDDSIV